MEFFVTHGWREWADGLPASRRGPRQSQAAQSAGGHGLQGPAAHLPDRRTPEGREEVGEEEEEERGRERVGELELRWTQIEK